jgi:hypothetical protein
MRNLGPWKVYESIGTFIDGVKGCFEAGINEFIFSYPNVEEQIPIFKKISREVIPELREEYS